MTLFADLLPMIWVMAVGATAWRRRPVPNRVHELLRSRLRSPPAPPLARLGAVLRSAARRPDAAMADSTLGFLVVVSAGALLAAAVWLPLGPALAGTLFGVSHWRRRTEIRLRVDSVVHELPEVVDLFVLASSAGLTVPLAVQAVAARSSGPIGNRLKSAVGRTALGEPLTEALGGVLHDVGEPIRPLIGALIASERYGTNLVPELERAAAEARMVRRRRTEVAARRLPVQLLFPLVLCTLPAFLVLTVVPLMVNALRTLQV